MVVDFFYIRSEDFPVLIGVGIGKGPSDPSCGDIGDVSEGVTRYVND